VFVDGKSKLLLAGVLCVSFSVGSLADSYTETMEAAAALLESAKVTIAAAVADFEAREASAAVKRAAEAEAARAAAEAERLKAAADTVAAKKGKSVKAAKVDTAHVKKAAVAAPAVVDTASAKAVVDTAAAKAASVDSAHVDTAAARAAVVDSAAAVDSAAVKAAAVDSAAVKPVVKPAAPKAAEVARPPKVYPIVKPEIEMVLVKGGKFKMGCADEQENCVNDERPRHEVLLKDFYIGKYPVTQKQWWSVMGVNPSYREGENLPVEQVSWDDVQEFIKRLNVITGKTYRLPTEAEWEYAARGGARGLGKKFSGHEYLYDVAWYDYNSFGLTQRVGTKEPNELGVYDMLGNVWEWVGDWYDRFYYRESQLKNPSGPKYGNDRVIRGCSFNSEEGHCRESLRNYNKPGSRTIYLGFRLVQQ
jgi:formylglycine-generating enzyme required for sulfatase activity